MLFKTETLKVCFEMSTRRSTMFIYLLILLDSVESEHTHVVGYLGLSSKTVPHQYNHTSTR